MVEPKTSDSHVRHYPLDVPGATPFERYHHIELTDWDLLIADLMQDFMNPSPATAPLYGTPLSPSTIPWHKALQALHKVDPKRFHAIASLHESLLSRSPLQPSDAPRLCPSWNGVLLYETMEDRFLNDLFDRDPASRPPPPSLSDMLLSVFERYYLEHDLCSFRSFFRSTYFSRFMHEAKPSPVRDTWWARDKFLKSTVDGATMVQWDVKPASTTVADWDYSAHHAARAEGWRKVDGQTRRELGVLYDVFPGVKRLPRSCLLPDGSHPRTRAGMNVEAGFIYDFGGPKAGMQFFQLPLLFRGGEGRIEKGVDEKRWRGRGAHRIPKVVAEGQRGRRCLSEPPPGAWSSVVFDVANHRRGVPVPKMGFKQLEGRTRRRSLSRGRVQEMFDWDLDIPQRQQQQQPASEPKPRRAGVVCDNCGEDHIMSRCTTPCGHCGWWSPGEYDFFWDMVEDGTLPEEDFPGEPAETHFAPDCPTAKNNRCKCMPFPAFHTAKRCTIKCRPGCGHPDPKKHKGNAMTCAYRCCMCGIRNSHAGKDCRLKKCRCGGGHLGQDHGWNPTCRREGCDRFLCGVHCQGCFGTERPFDEVTRRCWKCRGLGQRPEVWGKEGGKDRRRWERKVEKVKRLFAGGSEGAEGGPKADEKEKGKQTEKDDGKDEPGEPTVNAHHGTEEGKADTEHGYQSIFGGRTGQDDVCLCSAPAKDQPKEI